MPRRPSLTDPISGLLDDTRALVTRMLRDNRLLRAQNAALEREVERLSTGWEEIRRLARTSPRTRQAGARSETRRGSAASDRRDRPAR